MKKDSARSLSKRSEKPSASRKLRRLTSMIKTKTPKLSTDAKRDSIAEETKAFLKAGHKIEQIPDGVSGQDPYGRGKPLTPGPPQK